MSSNNYEISSSGEDELVIDESKSTTALPKKKRLVKRKKMVVESDEESNSAPPIPLKKKAYKNISQQEAKKWQEVIETAKSFMTALKVDTENLTMLFDEPTLECFKKACQAWIVEQGISLSLTFTTQKTFITVMARFVFDFVLKFCDLHGKDSLNVCGAVVWIHNCAETLKCLHGSTMIQKEQIIEMDVTSENGQKALKENPTKTKVTTNRWGRNIVQLKNEDAVACVNDANTSTGSFSQKSCGMFFSEAAKALQAFRQIMAYQTACYPKMPQANSRLLMPIKCECNYLTVGGLPLLGRQICKMTAFTLTPPAVDEETVKDPAILASIENPAILVFQCCNPVYRASKTNPQKNCDFKISATDFVGALQLAKRFWSFYFTEAPIISVPEFKWSNKYQYQNSILPTPYEDKDECLF